MTFTITGGYFYDETDAKIVEQTNAADSVLFQLINLGANGVFDPVPAGQFVGGDDVLIDLPIDTNGNSGSAFSIGGTSKSIAGYFSRQFSITASSGVAEVGDSIGLRWWPTLMVQDYLNGIKPSNNAVFGQVHLSAKYTYTANTAYTIWVLPPDLATVDFDPAVTSLLASDFSGLTPPLVPTPDFTGQPSHSVVPAEPVLEATPNDTRFGDQDALALLNAQKAWYHSTGSSAVVVAVIDTGMDMDHPDLLPNLFTNTGENSVENGVDDDGNGFIDDLHGWDFVEGDNDPQDQNGHGTWMSGIIGASGDNSLGIAGVGWNVQLLPLRCGVTTLSETHVISAIDYVIALKQSGVNIAAINLSYIDPSSDAPTVDTPLKQAIDRAEAASILLVAAAGNNGLDNDQNGNGQDYLYPADYESVLSVASIQQNGALATDSNFGAHSVDLAAPGVSILSTANGGNYTSGSGTSHAAAFVSGGAALVKSYNPAITLERLKRVLLGSVTVTAELTDKVATNGHLDLERLMQAAIQDKWMQDYWGADWLNNPGAKLSGNNDGDSAPTLEEFVFATSPVANSDALLSERRGIQKLEDGSHAFVYKVSPMAGIVSITIEQSTNLKDAGAWSIVPEGEIEFIKVHEPSGLYEYRIDTGGTAPIFYRMIFENPQGLDF